MQCIGGGTKQPYSSIRINNLALDIPTVVSLPQASCRRPNQTSRQYQDCAYRTPSTSSRPLSVKPRVAMLVRRASRSGRSGGSSPGQAPCRRDAVLAVLFKRSDGALKKMISPLTGSALAISLFDLATPRFLMGTIRKCIACSILDKKTVSGISLGIFNGALIGGQRFTSLTYAWHAASAINPWSPASVMATIR